MKQIPLRCFFLLLYFFIPSVGYAKSPIPPVAHFCYGLWDNGNVPPFFEKTMKEWQKQGWTIHLWNRKSMDELLKKYPQLHHLSKQFTRKVQKADLVRYLIIYEYGGFYFDLDCRPQSSSLLHDLQKGQFDASAIFFIERYITPEQSESSRQIPIRQGKPEDLERIANFAFGAVAKHPIIRNILELLQYRCQNYPMHNEDYDILYKTGPDLVTECVHSMGPSYTNFQLQIIDNANYLNHVCIGTWRNNRDTEK